MRMPSNMGNSINHLPKLSHGTIVLKSKVNFCKVLDHSLALTTLPVHCNNQEFMTELQKWIYMYCTATYMTLHSSCIAVRSYLKCIYSYTYI